VSLKRNVQRGEREKEKREITSNEFFVLGKVELFKKFVK
jgi:hypothetical protein